MRFWLRATTAGAAILHAVEVTNVILAAPLGLGNAIGVVAVPASLGAAGCSEIVHGVPVVLALASLIEMDGLVSGVREHVVLEVNICPGINLDGVPALCKAVKLYGDGREAASVPISVSDLSAALGSCVARGDGHSNVTCVISAPGVKHVSVDEIEHYHHVLCGLVFEVPYFFLAATTSTGHSLLAHRCGLPVPVIENGEVTVRVLECAERDLKLAIVILVAARTGVFLMTPRVPHHNPLSVVIDSQQSVGVTRNESILAS